MNRRDTARARQALGAAALYQTIPSKQETADD